MSLAAKVNAASEGNHSHDNKTVLDGITAEKMTVWDSKAKITIGTSQPLDFTSGDLFIQVS